MFELFDSGVLPYLQNSIVCFSGVFSIDIGFVIVEHKAIPDFGVYLPIIGTRSLPRVILCGLRMQGMFYIFVEQSHRRSSLH